MRTLLSQRWFKIILTFTVVGAAFLIGTPYLVKYLARQWLLENGGDRVQVQDVDFNPFKGTLVFTGLDVQVDRETTLSFASAGLDIAWKPLLHRQISVQSVTLNGFNMIIDNRAADILSLGGIALPKQAGEADEMAGEGAPWTSGVTQLTLNDFHLRVLDPAIEADIRLEHLQLSDFAQWAPGQPASVDLAGAFNGAPVKIRGKLAPLADPARYEASVSVSKLQLDAFQSFAQPHLEKLSGLLTYDGELLIEQSANGLRIDEKGKIALDSVDLSVAQPPAGKTVRFADIRWRTADRAVGKRTAHRRERQDRARLRRSVSRATPAGDQRRDLLYRRRFSLRQRRGGRNASAQAGYLGRQPAGERQWPDYPDHQQQHPRDLAT